MIRHEIERYWDDEHSPMAIDFVFTRISVAQRSGNQRTLGFYKENMYSPIVIEDQEYYIKR
jgi:threonyl-tRNA synthetase